MDILSCAGCTLSTLLVGALGSFAVTVYLFIKRLKRK